MERTTPDDLLEKVLDSYEGTPDARLREIMLSLVRHLHGFVNDVQLTQDEWMAAIGILTATGDITDDRRQEFILWSDTLGISMLVDALANPLPEGAMESTVMGPFYVPGSPRREYGADLREGPGGTAAWVHGQVQSLDGEPIAGAELDIWQNGAEGLYAVQDAEGPEDHLRGVIESRDDGSYAFIGVRPIPYTVPHDGPVGEMIESTARHPWRPAHIHMIVRAPGYRTLATHIFDSTSDYLDSDAVYAVKPSLLREFVPRAADDPERPPGVEGEWCAVRNDIVLAPENTDGGDR
ncbi:MAG TPA: dioxygenase [Thermoleophilaceae bacterium]|jgi:catechol 1,2-dioxygenase